jgi:hypothetical protein
MLPKEFAAFDWSILLTSATYLAEARRIIPADRVHYLQPAIQERMSSPVDLSVIGELAGNMHQFIDGDKKTIKRWRGEKQLRYALAVYVEYKAFLELLGPQLLFFPPAETVEANILAGVARELGVEIVSCMNARHLGGSFFSQDIIESLPTYAQPNELSRQRAREFLRVFREKSVPALNIQPIAETLGVTPLDEIADPVSMPKWLDRVRAYTASLRNEPEGASTEGIRVRVMNSLPLISPLLRRIIRNSRQSKNAAFIRTHQASALPDQFIFYPLQYSPESSINMPAPYYVDQLRVVDAIRYSMPSGHLLVVKEHPAALEMRSRAFLKELSKRSGVVLVDTELNSRELIERASLTVSVTGSAAFEAFLLGRPSLVLGNCFFAAALGGVTKLDSLPEKMRHQMIKPLTDEHINEELSRIFSCIYPFIFTAPDYGYGAKYALRRDNLSIFLEGLKHHLTQSKFSSS